jgi:hypothetical protein
VSEDGGGNAGRLGGLPPVVVVRGVDHGDWAGRCVEVRTEQRRPKMRLALRAVLPVDASLVVAV